MIVLIIFLKSLSFWYLVLTAALKLAGSQVPGGSGNRKVTVIPSFLHAAIGEILLLQVQDFSRTVQRDESCRIVSRNRLFTSQTLFCGC